jgi:hypothetical protein
MMDVALDRFRNVPLPYRQPSLPRQRLTPGALAFAFVEQVSEVGVGLDDADEISPGQVWCGVVGPAIPPDASGSHVSRHR